MSRLPPPQGRAAFISGETPNQTSTPPAAPAAPARHGLRGRAQPLPCRGCGGPEAPPDPPAASSRAPPVPRASAAPDAQLQPPLLPPDVGSHRSRGSASRAQPGRSPLSPRPELLHRSPPRPGGGARSLASPGWPSSSGAVGGRCQPSPAGIGGSPWVSAPPSSRLSGPVRGGRCPAGAAAMAAPCWGCGVRQGCPCPAPLDAEQPGDRGQAGGVVRGGGGGNRCPSTESSHLGSSGRGALCLFLPCRPLSRWCQCFSVSLLSLTLKWGINWRPLR